MTQADGHCHLLCGADDGPLTARAMDAMPVTAADGARNHRDVAPGPTPADGAATRVDGAASRIKAARVQTSRT